MKKMQETSKEDALQRQQDFEHWFQTFLGRLLLNAERKCIDNRVHRLFGYQQLDLALSHRLPVASHSMLGNKIMVVPEWQSELPENVVVSNSHELPFTHESCDLVVLHHTLDFSPNPHQSLREVSRVLKSGGHVVIVGFNPISLWGIRRLFSRFSEVAPWCARFIS
jgi:SAM-dependent methyltransferase